MGVLIVALAALLPSLASAQGTVSPIPVITILDTSGNPVNNAKICTYLAGTSTPEPTYTTSALNVENTNPTRTSIAGRATIFLRPGQSYKFIVLTAGSDNTCATGTLIWSQDNVSAVPASNVSVDIDGVAGESIAAGEVVYLSDGSGGKTAGSWYLADADLSYASVTPEIGMAPSAIVSGATGSIRIQGRTAGLSGLVTGATYYVSTTAGALTSSVPSNIRRVGQADSATALVTTPNPPTSVATQIDPRIKTLSNGRLTLTTGVPVTTSDVTAATTLYWSPYEGNQIALYSSSAWVTFALAELSIAVPATTATVYDVFVDYNSGTPALATKAFRNSGQAITGATNATPIVITANTHGLSNGDQVYVSGVLGNTAANGTFIVANIAANTFELVGSAGNGAYTASTGYFNARASDGLLVSQDGVLVLTGATTKRYVGSFRTTAVSGQTEDSAQNRLVWNYYNRIPRSLLKLVATSSWNYTLATWRQMNASTANQITVVIGVQEADVFLNVGAIVQNDTGGAFVAAAIGLDSTTVPAGVTAQRPAFVQIKAASEIVNINGQYTAYPAVGFHTFALLESAEAVGTTTWHSNANLFTTSQTGATGWIK